MRKEWSVVWGDMVKASDMDSHIKMSERLDLVV